MGYGHCYTVTLGAEGDRVEFLSFLPRTTVVSLFPFARSFPGCNQKKHNIV
jgi:hypothetical protein